MNQITLRGITLKGSLTLAALVLGGCTFDAYFAPPPAVVVETAPPDQGAVVVEAPPEVVYEAPPPQPEAGVVWIQPEYVLAGGRYELRHGHWDHPPQGRNHWVASRYERGAHGYVYVAGRWN